MMSSVTANGFWEERKLKGKKKITKTSKFFFLHFFPLPHRESMLSFPELSKFKVKINESKWKNEAVFERTYN